jgi:hypothetical protein
MAVVVTFLLSASALAGTVYFEDQSFDVADYTIEEHQTRGATINTTQTLMGSNPVRRL